MNKWKLSGQDKLFSVFVYVILLGCTLAILFPLIYVLGSSFATKAEILERGFFLIPREWSLNAYGYLFSNAHFMQSFLNAVEITVCGTLINLFFTMFMAYGLSKSWLKGRTVLNYLVLVTMVFGGGMIPTFMIVKELGLLNSYWALYLLGAIAPFNLIVVRSFFQSIPLELEEAARIDGCGEFRLLWKIVIPLSMPVLATFTLFYAVGNWNTYFSAILYLNDSAKWPLQVFLRQMLIVSDATGMDDYIGTFEYSQAVKMAAVVITAAPLLIIYPFLQKYFNQGMLLGSVKG